MKRPRHAGIEEFQRRRGDATLIESSVMADLDRPAARPRRSCLDVSNVEGELGCSQPTLEDDLAALEAAFSDYSS